LIALAIKNEGFTVRGEYTVTCLFGKQCLSRKYGFLKVFPPFCDQRFRRKGMFAARICNPSILLIAAHTNASIEWH
jgi:hypothetical protein